MLYSNMGNDSSLISYWGPHGRHRLRYPMGGRLCLGTINESRNPNRWWKDKPKVDTKMHTYIYARSPLLDFTFYT